MDLTALELGLRNRQLLQVKCFLKIQVETFRYFLSEQLPRMNTTQEKMFALDKFFTHDWQNVINKIISVAVVHMAGDYVSMMLAVSLFRAVVQACNQLIVMLASSDHPELNDPPVACEESSKILLCRSTVSSLSTHSNSSFDNNQPEPSSMKERLFTILQRQIESITTHIEHVYNANNKPIVTEHDSSIDSQHKLDSVDCGSVVDLIELFKTDKKNEDSKDNTILNTIQLLHSSPSEHFFTILPDLLAQSQDKLALVQYLAKKCQLSQETSTDQSHCWLVLVERLIELVCHQLTTQDITDQLIEEMEYILAQSGLSSLYMFFCIFIRTFDAKLRQKILQVFFNKFGTFSKLQDSIQFELSNLFIQVGPLAPNIDQPDLAKYLKFMSIIDLYTFCFRPKLTELEHLELSIEWILNAECEHSYIKAFILPALEEIALHPELFNNWESLNKQIFGDLWQHVADHFVKKTDFPTLVNGEILWQYWLDEGKVDLVVSWLENGHCSLPYCQQLTIPDDHQVCRRMVQYLHTQSSCLVQQKILQAFCTKRILFGRYTLYQLTPELFNFQTMLGHLGQCEKFQTNKQFLELFFGNSHSHQNHHYQIPPSSSHFTVPLLVTYCLRYKLYELLYMLCRDYRSLMEPVIVCLLQKGGRQQQQFDNELSIQNEAVLKLLLDFVDYDNNDNDDEDDDDEQRDKEFLFEKSFQTMQFLWKQQQQEQESPTTNDSIRNDDEKLEQTNKHDQIVDGMVKLLFDNNNSNSVEMNLILLTLALSKQNSFEKLALAIHENVTASVKGNLSITAITATSITDTLSHSFWAKLNSKYPLIFKSFERYYQENVHHNHSSLSNSSRVLLRCSTPERKQMNKTQIVDDGDGDGDDDIVPVSGTYHQALHYDSLNDTIESVHSFTSVSGTHTSNTVDLYWLLQQAIPCVNVNKFFRWQIKRRNQHSNLFRTSSPLGRDNIKNNDSEVQEYDTTTSSPQSSSSFNENLEFPNFSQNRLSEIYGLKTELTSSYYLKNSRLLDSFFKCFTIKLSPKQAGGSGRLRDQSLNEKIALKAFRKAALIAYGSIRQNSVQVCSLLFQSLIQQFLCSSKRFGSGDAATKMAFMVDATRNANSNNNNTSSIIMSELNKTKLHLTLGKLIIEFVPELLSVHSSQHQQVILSTLLRKSHFNNDRLSSLKLLDLASIAMQRKHSAANRFDQNKHRNTTITTTTTAAAANTTTKLHSLLHSPNETSSDTVSQFGDITTTTQTTTTTSSHNMMDDQTSTNVVAQMLSPLEETPLLVECFEWKPLLTFADLYHLKRPNNFLIKCAQEDNWLVFSLYAQLYAIDKDEIQTLLRENIFNNHCIGEHLIKAFQSSHRLTNAFTRSTTEFKLLKAKQAPEVSRNEFYTRLFKGKISTMSTDSGNQDTQVSGKLSDTTSGNFSTTTATGSHYQQQVEVTSEASEHLSMSSSPETFSIGSMSVMSKLSDENGSKNPLVLFEDHLKPHTVNKDFLRLLLEINQNCIRFMAQANYGSGNNNNNPNLSMENILRNTLLYAAVSLSNPVLALLASSIEKMPRTQGIQIQSPSSSESAYRSSATEAEAEAAHTTLEYGTNSQLKFISFMCWLLARVSAQTKQLFLDAYIYSNHNNNNSNNSNSSLKNVNMVQCYLSWNHERSLHLIEVLTREDARTFVILLEGLQIFDLDIAILNKLLQFLILFFIEKDYYQSEQLLLEFKSLLQGYNENDFLFSKGVPPLDYDSVEVDDDELMCNYGSLRILYSKAWIEKCALILVTNSLLLARQFELGILLSHYNLVRLQESFTLPNLRIPDLRNLYLFSQCLVKLPSFTLPIGELLHHGPALSTTGESDYTEYVSIFRKLILDLQEAGYFEEARNIINLLPKANVTEFIINEWMLKAKQANKCPEVGITNNDSIILDRIDLSFWESCWAQVTKLDPSMHSAFKVMERFVQHLEQNQVMVKCFLLHKCMIAIESILRDFVESLELSLHKPDFEPEMTTEPMFDELSTGNLDLIQDYFQFEHSLWCAAVECEYLIMQTHKWHPNNNDKSDDSFVDSTIGGGGGGDTTSHSMISIADTYDEPISNAWKLIWKDIVHYIRSSIFGSHILPRISKKHSYFYKSSIAKRNKEIALESNRQPALNAVIGKLLDHLCLQKARDVASLFDYRHEDFEIIQACDNAAKGDLTNISDAPFAVQFKIQHLDLSTTATTNATSKSVQSYSLFSTSNLNTNQARTISLIQTFIDFATIGKKSCKLILLYYKIASILSIPYTKLMDSRHYSSLKVLHLLLAFDKPDSSSSSSRTESLVTESSTQPAIVDDSTSLHSTKTVEITNTNTEEIEFGVNRQSIGVSKHYQGAIACIKELIDIVGEQDDQLNSEEKIATHLAVYTATVVQQMVQRQFDSFHSTLAITNSVTEIELNKNQLSFYNARFLMLIKLMKEPSLLGHALLDICKKLKTKVKGEQTKEEEEFMMRKHYVQLVELYIRAHECFTAQCDVHSIALVLRKTRLLITQELQPARYFHLILRLLTGIGRYSEMTYCFDLFRECDRFELILSKRVQRTPQLRVALLNYIKSCENLDELLPLVAIRFFLYRETADYHRARAERLLAEMVSHWVGTGIVQSQSKSNISGGLTISHKRVSSTSLTEYLTNSVVVNSNPPNISHTSLMNVALVNSMRDQLETIMYEFQEAESSYTKASSHTNADYCSRKSQLVALQLYYFNQTKPVAELAATGVYNTSTVSIPLLLKLEPGQVREYISQCTRFGEALIVSRGYPEINIDWVDSFFGNVILRGNTAYLEDYADTFPISLNMLKNLAKRYEQLSVAYRKTPSRIVGSSSSSNQAAELSSSLTNSPSSASFNSLLGQIRSENELQKARASLQQLLERVFCQGNNNGHGHYQSLPPLTCEHIDVKEKYKLATQLNCNRIIQWLLETDLDSGAYLADLRRAKRL